MKKEVQIPVKIFHTIAGTIIAGVKKETNEGFELLWPGVLQLTTTPDENQSSFTVKARIDPLALVGQDYTLLKSGVRGMLVANHEWLGALFNKYVEASLKGKFKYNPLVRGDEVTLAPPAATESPVTDVAQLKLVPKEGAPEQTEMQTAPLDTPNPTGGTTDGPAGTEG